VTVRPEKDEFSDSVSEFMQRNKLKIDLQFRPNIGSLQTPCTEFISKELRTPDADYFSPSYDPSTGEYLRGYSVFTSGYQSVDRLSDIDEFEESFKCMSVEDKTRHYYTLFRDLSPMETPQGSPLKVLDKAYLTIEESQTCADSNNKGYDSAVEDSLLDDDNSIGDESDLNSEIVCAEEDDESTPHIGSETSITQSPSSVGKISQKEEAKLPIIEHNESPPNKMDRYDAKINDINAIPNDISLEQKEKSEDRVNVKAAEDNKITMESSKQNVDTGSENSSEHKVNKADQGIVLDNESSPHYRSGDEPEPIDLTHLNIEASMMCLASKVRSVCGKANSPTLSNRTFRFKELDSLKRTTSHKAQNNNANIEENGDKTCQDLHFDTDTEASSFKIPDVPSQTMAVKKLQTGLAKFVPVCESCDKEWTVC